MSDTWIEPWHLNWLVLQVERYVELEQLPTEGFEMDFFERAFNDMTDQQKADIFAVLFGANIDAEIKLARLRTAISHATDVFSEIINEAVWENQNENWD